MDERTSEQKEMRLSGRIQTVLCRKTISPDHLVRRGCTLGAQQARHADVAFALINGELNNNGNRRILA